MAKLSGPLYSHGRNTYQCSHCKGMTSNILPPQSCGACGLIFTDTVTETDLHYVGPVQVTMFMYKCGICGDTGRSSEPITVVPERCRCGIKFRHIVDDMKVAAELAKDAEHERKH